MPAMISFSAALFIAWLLATAGWQKFTHPAYYSETIGNYLPLGQTTANSFGFLLGALELTLAVMLIAPATRQAAGLLAAALLTLYLVAMAWQLIQGKANMDCGCAGPDKSQFISPLLLIRNCILIVIAGTVAMPAQTQSWLSLDTLTAVLASLFFIVTYLCFEQLLANRPKLAAIRN